MRIAPSHVRLLALPVSLLCFSSLPSCKKAAAGNSSAVPSSKVIPAATETDVKPQLSPDEAKKLSKQKQELESLQTRISLLKAEIREYPMPEGGETSSEELRDTLDRSRNKLSYLKQTSAKIDKEIKRYESEIASEPK